jgi:hypothetical protein
VRSRKVQIAVGVALVAVVVVVVLLLTRQSADGPYALTAWEYGAIAWVEPVAEDVAGMAETAAELFESVFTLWGLSPPEAIAEGRVARKADPAGGRSVDLRALEWKGAILPPILVVVFSDAQSMAEATGLPTDSVTLTYGNALAVRYDEEQTLITLSSWLVDLTGASVAFLCTADRWQEQLVSEAAKWMLRTAMSVPEICVCEMYSLPALVTEGIAGYTAAQLMGGEGWRTAARAWAAENEITTNLADGLLQFDVEPETLSVLGTSFIAYLVEEHGADGMLNAFCDWVDSNGRYCMLSTSRTVAYIRGWRTFLGVEAE